MLLFILCLNPLLHALDVGLIGIKIGQNNTKVAVAAYADDVTVFLTSSGLSKVTGNIVNLGGSVGGKSQQTEIECTCFGTLGWFEHDFEHPLFTNSENIGF